MTRKLIITTLLCSVIFAQERLIIKVNNLTIPIFSDGNIGGSGDLFGSWEYMLFNDKPVLWNAGFFLSGFVNDSLWVNASTQSEHCYDYLPGTVNQSNIKDQDKIYQLSVDDPPFGTSWQEWSEAVEKGAYYYDGDQNGKYEPIDKNKNNIWESSEDRPDLLYNATYFTVYNDSQPDSFRYTQKVSPLGIEVRQTIFLSTSVDELKNTVFIRYSIINTGFIADTLNDVIFSIYANPEIGYLYHYNNLIGCDTTIQSSFSYNEGEDDTWGIKSPSIFFTLLQGPVKESFAQTDTSINNYGTLLGQKRNSYRANEKMAAHSSNYRFYPDFTDDPTRDKFELRNKMLGKLVDGLLIDPCDFWYGKTEAIDCSDIDPKYLFSGDPVLQTGWLCTFKVWQRHITSTGIFELVKDQPQDIIVAYTVGQGNDAVSSITAARERVKFVIEEYNNNFPNSFTEPNYEEIYPKSFSLSQNYPNPFNPSTKIKFTIASVGLSGTSPYNTKLIVYDILGRQVKTLVNEVKSPGTYEVQFDASQFASGVYFYKLTAGDFVQTKKMILLR